MEDYNFQRSTLKKIKEFREKKAALMKQHKLTHEEIRSYLEGNLKLPEDITKEIDYLESIREEAIKSEMQQVAAKAKNNGLEIPEKYLTGKALDPIIEPELINFSKYIAVYEFFNWYNPVEVAQFIDSNESKLTLKDLKKRT